MEYHSGRMKQIDLNGKTPEEYFISECEVYGITEKKEYSWQAKLEVQSRKKFFNYKNEELYEMIEHRSGNEDDYEMKLYDNADGTISFVGSFYNGGTCLEEMLEESFEKRESGS